MDKNALNAISASCTQALKYDDMKQFNLALKEYGNCIKLIGQTLSNSTFTSLCENPRNVRSMINIAQQCTSRTNDILADQEIAMGKFSQQSITPRSPTTTISNNSRNSVTSNNDNNNNNNNSIGSGNTLTRLDSTSKITPNSLALMSIEELEKGIRDIDSGNTKRKQQMDELMQLQRKSDYSLIKEITVKYEEAKMLRIQMEQYLRMKLKKREQEEEQLAQKARRDRDKRMSQTELKRLSVTVSKHLTSATPDAEKWLQMILKHFDYSKKKDHLARDQQFLQRLILTADRESYIRMHMNQITNPKGDHPFVDLLHEFSTEFDRRYNAQSAWVNVKEAVSMVKAFAIQLTEIVTAQWTTYVPTTKKLLYYTNEQSARRELDEMGIITSYVLWIPLLNNVIFYVYNNLMDVYYMQTQNLQIDNQLKRLDLTLVDLDVPEPFSLRKYSDESIQPYRSAVNTLSKLSSFSNPEDLLAVIFKTYLDIVAEVQSYSSKYSIPVDHMEEYECTLVLYVILQTKPERLSCVCNMIEDFVALDQETSQVLNIFLSALQWSLEFNPDDWEKYAKTKNNINQQQQQQQQNFYPLSSQSVSEEAITENVDDSDDYLGDLDMNSINLDLQDKLSSILAPISPKPTIDPSELQKLKKLVDEKEEQIQTIVEEKNQQQKSLNDQISQLSDQVQELTSKMKTYELQDRVLVDKDHTINQLMKENDELQAKLTLTVTEAANQSRESDRMVRKLMKENEELQAKLASITTSPSIQSTQPTNSCTITETVDAEVRHDTVTEATEYTESPTQYSEVQNSVVGRYRALYDFIGIDSQELNFSEGDILVVTDESRSDGWWMAHMQTDETKCGYVPSNFLELLQN